MPPPGFWSRIREARLARVLLVYLAASWLVLQVTALLQDRLQLPEWVTPFAFLLLLAGLVVVSATAWVQSRPATKAREGELPSGWEVDVRGLVRSLTKGRFPHLTWARAMLGGVVAFSLLFGAAGIYLYLQERGSRVSLVKDATAAPAPGIAVIPFRVVGPDLDLWREGMVDLVSTNLEGVGGLRSIDPRVIISRRRSIVGDETESTDRAGALRVAREVGASYAVTGSAVALGSDVRLTAEVHDVRSGTLLGTARVDGPPDSVLALVDRLCMELLRSGLVPAPADLPQLNLSRVTTKSLPALKAYLEGEQKFRRARAREAITDFERAVKADSTFALALYRLALAYSWAASPHGMPGPGAEYGRQAARFADRLPRREQLLLQANAALLQWRLDAIELLEELTGRYPDDVEGWFMLGDAYFHLGGAGLYPREKFRNALRRVLELHQSFGPAYLHLIEDAFHQQDSTAVAQLLARLREVDPASPEAIGLSIAFDLAWGDSASRKRSMSALETAETDALLNTKHATNYAPDLWEQTLLVARAIVSQDRHPLVRRAQAQIGISHVYFLRGRIREALASDQASAPLEGADSLSADWMWYYVPWHLAGYTHSSIGARAANVLATDSTPEYRFWLAAIAASQNRWDEVERQIRFLELSPPDRWSEGAARNVGEKAAALQVLRGYAAAERADRRAAVDELERARPTLGIFAGPFVRYQLGRLHLHMGNLEAAERYFKSFDIGNFQGFPYYAPAEFYLGQIYERWGEAETAKVHYARFVRWWEDCDPELRPWWEEGQRALERLTSEAVTR